MAIPWYVEQANKPSAFTVKGGRPAFGSPPMGEGEGEIPLELVKEILRGAYGREPTEQEIMDFQNLDVANKKQIASLVGVELPKAGAAPAAGGGLAGLMPDRKVISKEDYTDPATGFRYLLVLYEGDKQNTVIPLTDMAGKPIRDMEKEKGTLKEYEGKLYNIEGGRATEVQGLERPPGGTPVSDPRKWTSVFGKKPGEYGYEAMAGVSNMLQGLPANYQGEQLPPDVNPADIRDLTDSTGKVVGRYLVNKEGEFLKWLGPPEDKTLQELEALYGPTVYSDEYDPDIGQVVRTPRFAYNPSVPHPGGIQYEKSPEADTIADTIPVPGRPGFFMSVNKYGQQVGQPFTKPENVPVSQPFTEYVNGKLVTYTWVQTPGGGYAKADAQGNIAPPTDATDAQWGRTVTAHQLGRPAFAGAQLTNVSPTPQTGPGGFPINFSGLKRVGQGFSPEDYVPEGSTKTEYLQPSKEQQAVWISNWAAQNAGIAERGYEEEAMRRRRAQPGWYPARQR